ncbi:MAG: phosphate/phosphite/phosphonate ABC transporter substrate-binding protein [Gammaproteobacteria bacterium]|nr:phosphate/phosphite/phosphonate ABC transporter substrate-binding protein [Gammaproteobacteria bacterium]
MFQSLLAQDNFLTEEISDNKISASAKKIYTIGVVPQFEARRLASIWMPLLKQLSIKTGHQFELHGASSIAEFEKAFMMGKYDFAYMNPYHLILANQLQGYLPLVNDASKKLRGVLVVRKDSNINNASDLDGKIIAFPSPNALGASLQMRQELHDLFKINFIPNYVKTHDSVYLNVLLGDAEAGGGVGKTLKRQLPQYQQALKVIHKTAPVAPHPIAVHPRVDKKVSELFKEKIIEMGKHNTTKSMLARIPIKQISAISLEAYKPLEKMHLDRFYIAPK